MKENTEYRKISLEGLPVVGKGAVGNVYRYDEDLIVKVYNGELSGAAIREEMDKIRLAVANGIPSVISYGIVDCGGSLGLMMEMADSRSSYKEYVAHPERRPEIVAEYADLVKRVNATPHTKGGLPDFKEFYLHLFDEKKDLFTEEELAPFKRIVESVPDRDTMVHGDLHMRNVHFIGKEPILIDLADLGVGHPVFELLGITHKYVLMPVWIPHRVNRDGPVGVTGEESAEIWSLFCDTYFAGLPEETKRERIRAAELMGLLFFLKYNMAMAPNHPEYRARFGQTKKILGEELPKYEEFLKDVLSRWK